MKFWFRGKPGGLLVFLVISALVGGGLGWLTLAALRLEDDQVETRQRGVVRERLRLALWRLDSLIGPTLAREDSRPFHHYSTIYAPTVVLRDDGTPLIPGTVLEPTPLLNADLPEWMLLHFQVEADGNWRSPQVFSDALASRLQKTSIPVALTNRTPERRALLDELGQKVPAKTLLALVEQQGSRPSLADLTMVEAAQNPASGNYRAVGQLANPQVPEQQQQQVANQMFDPEYLNRDRAGRGQGGNQLRKDMQQQTSKSNSGVAIQNEAFPDAGGMPPGLGKSRSEQVQVTLGSMVPFWLKNPEQPARLVVARQVQVANKFVCQGVLLDWPLLQESLRDNVTDLFPNARLVPIEEEAAPLQSERAMASLPLLLDPGPLPPELVETTWTTLRVGLVLAWTAALIALAAVGLGGWSLIDLSERRIRFVSAVTHELRTPLTTLRLYLDMLSGGMIREEKQRDEYLHTLNVEADRLNRLVGNVLDFSRLENQRPRVVKSHVVLQDLLEQVRSAWDGRCQTAQKSLIVDDQVGKDIVLFTDQQMTMQILGNLIDNACKYSRDAEDSRVIFRARMEKPNELSLEVEDFGPGVSPRERQLIFRPFRRGKGSETTAGGVGLGLALAQRWASLLGGKLLLKPTSTGQGACFALQLRVDEAGN